MSDAALENATARREAIGQQLDVLTAEINHMIERHAVLRGDLSKVDDFIRVWYEMAGAELPKNLERKKPEAPAEGGKRIRPRNPDRQSVAKLCVIYIRKAGRPLMRKDLYKVLSDDGVEIRGSDPLMVLSTMLWRSKDTIRRLKGGGYWPVADPVTPNISQDLEDIMSS